MTAEDLIARLALEPHPEGGHFVETYRQRPAAGRAAMTAIYYLLRAGETSAWHRLNPHFSPGHGLRVAVASTG
jgi:predicted cupin superfamily sugar epimerase